MSRPIKRTANRIGAEIAGGESAKKRGLRFMEEINSIKDPESRYFFLNPVTHVRSNEMEWNRTGNPVHVWAAIEQCIWEKLEFPEWVTAYLLDTGRRMRSPEAQESTDLRVVLPKIIGFPPKSQRGRYPLRPYSDADDVRMDFACEFAAEIKNGAKPIDALHDSCRVLDLKTGDKVDDKTLRGWVKEFFELMKWPRTNAGWRLVIRNYPKNLSNRFRA
jgi:hypothetical protein